jgi:hypothetical protein
MWATFCNGGFKTQAVSSATRWGGKPAATDTANKVVEEKKQSPGASPLIQEDAPGR